MSRIINQNDPGRERKYLSRAVVVAIRNLPDDKSLNIDIQEIITFVILSLESISRTVDKTVLAWEKRDYWLKADRFRLEWDWVEKCSDNLKNALIDRNYSDITRIINIIGKNLSNVKVPENNRIGTPWKGITDSLK